MYIIKKMKMSTKKQKKNTYMGMKDLETEKRGRRGNRQTLMHEKISGDTGKTASRNVRVASGEV